MTATSRSDVRYLLRTACQACRASFNHSSRGRWASHGERSRCPGAGPGSRVAAPHGPAQEPQLSGPAGIRGGRRGSGGGHRLLLPEAGRPRPEVLLHHAPGRAGLPRATTVVAGAGRGGGRRARRPHPALPAGNRRPPSGRRLQGRRGGGQGPRPARHRLRRPRHLDLRRRPGAGGAPDRDRRRRRRADRPPGQEGRAGPGRAGHRRRRELRRPVHAAGQSAGGGVPAAGGGRHRRAAWSAWCWRPGCWRPESAR